jgi:hypothetical protein
LTAVANQFGQWRTGALANNFRAAGATGNNLTRRNADARVRGYCWFFGMQPQRSRPWAEWAGAYYDWVTPPALSFALVQSLDGVVARQATLALQFGAAVQRQFARSAAIDAAARASRTTGNALAAALADGRTSGLGIDSALARAASCPTGCDGALKASLTGVVGIDAALGGALSGFGGRGVAVPPRAARTLPNGARASVPGARDVAVTLPDGRTVVVPPGNRRN